MDNTQPSVSPEREVVLLDLLDRAIDKGVVVYGEIVLSVADVDLVYVGLKVLLSSVETVERLRGEQLPAALRAVQQPLPGDRSPEQG